MGTPKGISSSRTTIFRWTMFVFGAGKIRNFPMGYVSLPDPIASM